MEHLSIKELCEFIKKHSPKLVNAANDIDSFLLERKPIELLMLAHEIQCSLKR